MEFEDIKSPKSLFNYMYDNIEYGFVNQDNIRIIKKDNYPFYYTEQLLRNYKFQSPEEVVLNKCGICYDQNELARDWFEKHNIEARTYYSIIRNHSILVYKDNNKYNWFELTLRTGLGIHDFDTLEELFEFYLFTEDIYHSSDICEYNIRDYGIDYYDLISKARSSKLVLKK